MDMTVTERTNKHATAILAGLYLGEAGRLDSRANRSQAGRCVLCKGRVNMERRYIEGKSRGNGLVEK